MHSQVFHLALVERPTHHCLLLRCTLCFFAASKYSREAGVRTLERRIAAVCRAVAVRVAESRGETTDPEKDKDLPPEMPIVIDENAIEDILGVSDLKPGNCFIPSSLKFLKRHVFLIKKDRRCYVAEECGHIMSTLIMLMISTLC